MKIKIAMALLACLCVSRCATFFHVFPGPQSDFYSEREKEILAKTTKSIEFDYGYDQFVELDYVFPMTRGYAEFKTNDKELVRATDGVDDGALIAFSEKIYRLRKITMLKMEKFRAEGDWRDYTFLDKYLLPPLTHYSGVLEKQVIKRDRTYMNQLEKRKKAIDKNIEFEMRRQEFEDIWKTDYNS
jgi:hypothetical protein